MWRPADARDATPPSPKRPPSHLSAAAAPSTTGPDGELAHAWDVLASLALIFYCVMGATLVGPPAAFALLADTMGVETRAVQRRLPSTTMVSWLVTTPAHGILVDAFGASAVVRLGVTVCAACAAAYPFAPTLWAVQVLHGLMGASLACTGVFAIAVVANSWFSRRRATALAVVVAAFSVAGGTWPLTVAAAAGLAGGSWRAGMGAVAAAMVLVALPLSWHVARRSREGLEAASAAPPSPVNRLGRRGSDDNLDGMLRPWRRGRGLLATLCTRRAAAAGALHGAAGFVIMAVTSALPDLLTAEEGASMEASGAVQAALACCSIVGKLLCGAGLDGPRPRAAGFAGSLAFVAGCAALLRPGGGPGAGPLRLATGPGSLAVFAVCYGLGFGAAFALLAQLPGRLYGSHPAFAQIQALMGAAYIAGGLGGVIATPELARAAGSYAGPFAAYTAAAAVFCGAYAVAGKPEGSWDGEDRASEEGRESVFDPGRELGAGGGRRRSPSWGEPSSAADSAETFASAGEPAPRWAGEGSALM